MGPEHTLSPFTHLNLFVCLALPLPRQKHLPDLLWSEETLLLLRSSRSVLLSQLLFLLLCPHLGPCIQPTPFNAAGRRGSGHHLMRFPFPPTFISFSALITELIFQADNLHSLGCKQMGRSLSAIGLSERTAPAPCSGTNGFKLWLFIFIFISFYFTSE